jgi:RND superfamily putative drug exporter
MSDFLARIARLFTRRWGRGLIGALVLLFVLGGIAASGQKAPDDFAIPGTESQSAIDLLKAHSPAQAGVDSQIVFAAKSGKLTDPENKASIEKALAKVSSLRGVAAAVSPFEGGGASISKDGTIGLTTVQYTLQNSDIEKKDGTDLLAAADIADTATLQANVRGALADYAAQQDAPIGELVGLILAGFLLFFLFRSAAAMLVTILAALLGVFFAEMLLAAVSKPLGLPDFAAFLAGLLGLGAGIDYSLLVIGRFREQRADGFSVGDSAAKAAATAGSAVVTAGLIVMVAIAGLLAIGIPFLGKMGVGAAVGVAAVVLSAVTLLPMLIGAFKKWLRPKKASQVAASPAFARWGEIVTAKPWASILVGVVVLLALATPALHLRIGTPDDSTKAKDDATRIAYDDLSKGFGPGSNGPFLIAIDVKKGEASNAAALATLQKDVAGTPGIVAAVPAQLSKDGEIATMIAIPKYSPQDARTSDVLKNIRDNVIPAATKGTDLKAFVGGQTAALEDLSAKTAKGLPVFIAVVIGLSVLLLMAAFRSLWIPLVSAVFNLLSVGAAFGIVTAVFQDGVGAGLIGAGDGGIPIAFYVPVMLFAILFGLSMDYNVFLLSRIHEAHKEGDGPRESVIHGMGRIGKVILFAGLIMTSVFIAFTAAPDVGQKMIGIGLGLAILLDVLIVRLIIAPAVVLILGEKAWWIPAWLDKILPNVSLEGHLVESQEPKEPSLADLEIGAAKTERETVGAV